MRRAASRRNTRRICGAGPVAKGMPTVICSRNTWGKSAIHFRRNNDCIAKNLDANVQNSLHSDNRDARRRREAPRDVQVPPRLARLRLQVHSRCVMAVAVIAPDANGISKIATIGDLITTVR
mmetsp:Transcript_28562/g.73516  ORF Transcript_28562/g.73516 Transcript_28562/m.73516 type:complete len:122 (-) Transcript_28562:98-463(-)